MAQGARAKGSGQAVQLQTETDTATPRVRMVLRGKVKGDLVADAFIRLYAEQPETALYDRLFDLTEYDRGFELEHLQRIAIAYRQANRDPSYPCRTAFVTYDPNFPLWAKSMGFQFSGREHRAFRSLVDAEAFLGEPIDQRTAFPIA